MFRSRGVLTHRLPLSISSRAHSTATPSYASEFSSKSADLGQELPPFILSLPNLGSLLDPTLALPSVRAASRPPHLALRSSRAQSLRSQAPRPHARPLVLDGAMADPLVPGCDIHIRNAARPTLAALLRAPALVRDVHLAYIAAGADILTTCNFSVDPAHISHALPQLSPAEVPAKLAELAALSGKVAEDARKQALAAADAALVEIRRLASAPAPASSLASAATSISSPGNANTPDPAANTSALSAVTALYATRPDLARFAHLALPGRCDIVLAGCLPPLSGVHPASVAAAQAVATAALAAEGAKGPTSSSSSTTASSSNSASSGDGSYNHDEQPNHDLSVSPPPLPVPSHALASAAASGDADAVQRVLSDIVVAALAPYVDCYLCESLTCIQHAEVAALSAMAGPVTKRSAGSGASKTTRLSGDNKTSDNTRGESGDGDECELGSKPVWVSWRLNDTDYGIPRLFSCETLAQAVDRLLHSLPRFVDAYLFNCSSPSAITASLPLLRQVTRRPIGAYARLQPTPLEPLDYGAGSMGLADATLAGTSMTGGAAGAGALHEMGLVSASSLGATRLVDASDSSSTSHSPCRYDSTASTTAAAVAAGVGDVDVGERRGRERSPASPLLPQPHWLDSPSLDNGTADPAAATATAAAVAGPAQPRAAVTEAGAAVGEGRLEGTNASATAAAAADAAAPGAPGGVAPPDRTQSSSSSSPLYGATTDSSVSSHSGLSGTLRSSASTPSSSNMIGKSAANGTNGASVSGAGGSGISSDYTATLLGSQASRRAAAPLSALVRATQRARTRADSARAYAALAARWSSDLGADVIGGCCGVGLLHVRRLALAAEAVVEGGDALQAVLKEGVATTSHAPTHAHTHAHTQAQ